MSTTTNIISRHATVAEAVKAANIDLSYNKQAAESKIKDLDSAFRGCFVSEAFVTDKGVYFVYHCDIKILNKFEPFHSCLDDTAFSVVDIGEKQIVISSPSIAKNSANRKSIAKLGIIVG